MKINTRIATIAVAGGLALGGLGVAASNAIAEDSPTPIATSTSQVESSTPATATDDTTSEQGEGRSGPRGDRGPGMHRGERMNDFAEALSDGLDVDQSAVKSALQEIHEEHRAEMEQARENGEERTRPTDEERQQRQAQLASDLADKLNVPESDVTSVLAEQEAEREDEREQMQAERGEKLQERLDQAVADGDLTQAQADAVMEAHDAGVLPGPKGMRGPHGR